MSTNFTTAVAINRLRTSNQFFGFVLALVLVLLCLPLFIQSRVNAADNRVVTIYADGSEQSFVTDAETVGEALNRANVVLAEEDLVEPGQHTEITSDSFKINIYRARPILVIDGDKRVSVMTPYQSPRLIAEDAGLTVYPEDEFELTRVNNFVAESTLGLRLVIDRATPVRLNMYGTTETVRTQSETVGEFVSSLELKDESSEVVVRPAAEKALTAGMTIHVVAVSDDTIAVEESIPYPIREIRDTSRPLGYEDVKTPGRDGSKLVTYKVVLENGQEVSRKEVSSVVIEQPVQAVVVVGAKYDMADAFAQLRQCEAGGVYSRNSGNGFYGAYQFMYQTWQSVAPDKWKNTYPHEAPPSVQDQAAATLQKRSGWGQWPACSKKLGLR